MATYHNEKPLSEIALVNCFNKITANGIRTAEQLRQTEYYQEAMTTMGTKRLPLKKASASGSLRKL